MKNKKVIGITSNHKNFLSDIVICNSDFSYTIRNLIPRQISNIKYSKKYLSKLNYSCSTFILHLFLKKKYKVLDVHNIILNNNEKESLLAPFIKGDLPKEYIYYIYCPSSIDKSLTPPDCECLNITLRVQNLHKADYKWNKSQISNLRNKILYDISKIKGLEDIKSNIIYESYKTPLDFKNDYNCYYGSSFGLNHNLLQSTAFRPQSKIKSVKNLYFVGDSVHPGAGISMVLNSSKICVETILSDFS